MKPSFLGLGVQKCASTWLYRLLEDHQDIQTTDPKELDFFSRGYAKGLYWYESFFTGNTNAKIAGEISPSYFYDALAPARAYRYNPDFKIIVSFRDPVSRIFSNHLHEIRAGRTVPGDNSVEAGLLNNMMYLEQSRYATHLRKWLDYYPIENFIFFLQEEIEEQPSEQADRLFKFLGLPWSAEMMPLDRRSNASVVPKSAVLDGMLKTVSRAARDIGLGNHVERIKEHPLTSRLHSANTVALQQSVPPMRPETMEDLQEKLRGEVVELAHILGRDRLPWPTWQEQ